MEFSQKLRALRRARKPRLTQEAAARALGWTQRKISRLETGDTEPSLADLRALCRYYGVSADWLIGLGEEDGKIS